MRPRGVAPSAKFRPATPCCLRSKVYTHNVTSMNLNSPLFDRIRTKSKQAPVIEPKPKQACAHPGCAAAGEFKAPMGRLREGQYFCFCLDHVREYNATYNYFNGMSDNDVARFQKDAVIGHRPTWSMGVNRAARGFREDGVDPVVDPLGMFRAGMGAGAANAPRPPKFGVAAMKALATLGLDDTADAEKIKTRYKEWVKRLHPDANGGDRSMEEKLREIIQAYNYLRTAKLV